MNIRELNEALEKYIVNEVSDNLKTSYLSGVQAQYDKAKKRLEKAKKLVNKSDNRQISNLPQGIDKETATNALEDLKHEMKRIDYGSDWRLEENDGWLCLSVRYWGDWENPEDAEDEEDYDWQILSDEFQEKLNAILVKIQKKYGVQIHIPGDEKNWLSFEIQIIPSKPIEQVLEEEMIRIYNICKDMVGKELPAIPHYEWYRDSQGSGAYIYADLNGVNELDEICLYINDTTFNGVEGHGEDGNSDDVYVGYYYYHDYGRGDSDDELDFHLNSSEKDIKETFKKVYMNFYNKAIKDIKAAYRKFFNNLADHYDFILTSKDKKVDIKTALRDSDRKIVNDQLNELDGGLIAIKASEFNKAKLKDGRKYYGVNIVPFDNAICFLGYGKEPENRVLCYGIEGFGNYFEDVQSYEEVAESIYDEAKDDKEFQGKSEAEVIKLLGKKLEDMSDKERAKYIIEHINKNNDYYRIYSVDYPILIR